ncbi:MAG: 4a-hydroxytetrahydrobiopterin dehydratase [Leptolyngbyaceae cyanobacterium]
MNNLNSSQIILFLAANPKGTPRLRLDEEVRDIVEGLERSKHREKFELIQRWAVRPRDVQRAMLDVQPNIVHFSGHGSGEEGLLFEDEMGNPKLVEGNALARLFDLFSDTVRCVVLNGCYSEMQAQSISEYIDNVVGMQQAIGDQAALNFSVSFYDALGAGRSVGFAYDLGCNAIQMAGIPEQLAPVLKQKDKYENSNSNNLQRDTAPEKIDLLSLSIKDNHDALAVDDQELDSWLAKLPRGWGITNTPYSNAARRALRKEWDEYIYSKLLEKVKSIGLLSHQIEHHPDILISGYARITVESWSHTRKDITIKDFILAARIEELLASMK